MNKQELNKCAQKLHEAYISTGDYSLFDTPEYSLSWNIIFSTYAARNYGRPEYEDIVSEVLLNAIKSYDIQRSDFENFFNYCLKQKKNDKLKKEGEKSANEYSLDYTVEDSEGNEASVVSLTADNDEAYDIEGRLSEKLAIYNLYLMAAELALKRPSGKDDGKIGAREKKAMFYKKLIFTDMLSAYPLVRTDASEFFAYNKTKLDFSVDFDFANSFFVNSCHTVSDFRDNEFKSYYEFTHDPKHKDRLCADESNFARRHQADKAQSLVILYLEVYMAFVQAATGESISKTQISLKRDDFFKTLYEAYNTQYQ